MNGLFDLEAKNWLIYKLRGRVQPDHPEGEDDPVITGSQDAGTQYFLDLNDLSKKKKK